MGTSLFIILSLLFQKHWYIDFVNQSVDEVKYKGVYLHWIGLKHSLKHGCATLIIFILAGVTPTVAILAGILDFITHYHIDWVKMNFGNRNITTPQFWAHLGLDQLMHYMTYIVIIKFLL